MSRWFYDRGGPLTTRPPADPAQPRPGPAVRRLAVRAAEMSVLRERWQADRGVAKPVSSITPPPAAASTPDPILSDKPTLDELSRRYAERVLRETGGNKTKAAEALGIDRKTLSRLLREE